MITLIKVLVYVLFLGGGLLAGMLLSGRHIDYTITFDGIPAAKLSPAQIDRMSRRTSTVMEQRTSVVFNGRPIVTAGGQWLMWLVVLLPVFLGGVLAYLVNRSLFRKARRLSKGATSET